MKSVSKIGKSKEKSLLLRLKGVNPVFSPEGREKLFDELSLVVKDSQKIENALVKVIDSPASFYMLDCALRALSPVSYKEGVFDRIKENINHDDFLIRETAIESLSSNLEHNNVLDCLLEELNADFSYGDVRKGIVQALSPVSHDKTVKENLLKRLNDEDFFVREQAVKSLSSEINDEKVLLAIKQKLKDDDSGVVAAAKDALERCSKKHLLVTSKVPSSSNIHP
jgi:hypothetical protein